MVIMMTDEADAVYSYVKQKISVLSTDCQWSKAMLARLRRCVGKDIRDSEESWAVTLGDLPEDLCGRPSGDGFDPSRAEKAVHIALTLFALHMQGRKDSAQQDDRSFASAIRSVMNESNMDGIKRRFDSMVTSTDLNELAYHARGLVQIMRSSGDVRFDYAAFARDLYYYQTPNGQRNVLIRWGENFYMKSFETEED